jgi:GNAT superfamily N-acetyltransferase
VVTLPDYQGLGIGTRLAEAVGALWRAAGKRVSITASHPAVIRHCERSPLWRLMRVNRTGNRPHSQKIQRVVSAGRAVVAFEYVGAK